MINSSIFSKNYSADEVLVFVRKTRNKKNINFKLINNFLKKHLKTSNNPTISENKKLADFHIELSTISISDITLEDYKIINKAIDFNEIIIRERVFRSNADYYDSVNRILKLSKFYIDIFKKNNFKIIVGQVVDNYILDVLVRISKYFNINYIGIVRFFFEGYARLTIYGEYNNIRKPDNIEINSIYNRLLNKEKNVFNLSYTAVLKDLIKYYFIYKLKYIYDYLLMHKIFKKNEYDYIVTKFAVYPRSLIQAIKSIKFFNYNIKNLKSEKSTVYIPLHYFPEATTEYWISDLNKATYYPYFYQVLSELDENGYDVYIKEHPAMFLKRDVKFLEIINSFTNVYLISPFISTFDILKIVDISLIWTGTTGIESFINGNPTYKVCENYFSDFFTPFSKLNSNHLVYPKDQEKKLLIEKILSNTIKID